MKLTTNLVFFLLAISFANWLPFTFTFNLKSLSSFFAVVAAIKQILNFFYFIHTIPLRWFQFDVIGFWFLSVNDTNTSSKKHTHKFKQHAQLTFTNGRYFLWLKAIFLSRIDDADIKFPYIYIFVVVCWLRHNFKSISNECIDWLPQINVDDGLHCALLVIKIQKHVQQRTWHKNTSKTFITHPFKLMTKMDKMHESVDV